MKAIDTWKIDDPVLIQIHIVAYLFINLAVIIIFGFVLGLGLKGVWFAQIMQDLWCIVCYQGLYLCEDDIPRPFSIIQKREIETRASSPIRKSPTRKSYNSPDREVKLILQSYDSPEIERFRYGYDDKMRSHERKVKV